MRVCGRSDVDVDPDVARHEDRARVDIDQVVTHVGIAGKRGIQVQTDIVQDGNVTGRTQINRVPRCARRLGSAEVVDIEPDLIDEDSRPVDRSHRPAAAGTGHHVDDVVVEAENAGVRRHIDSNKPVHRNGSNRRDVDRLVVHMN